MMTRTSSQLIALIIVCFISTSGVAEGPRVKWGGVMFRGKAEDRERLFPLTSSDNVSSKLQDALAKSIKQVERPDCTLLVGQVFESGAGDSLVLGCVIEDEDILVAKVVGEGGEEYYGQVTIAASLVIFDFKQGVVISSAIVSSMLEFGRDRVMKSPPTTADLQGYVDRVLFGPSDQKVDLVSRVESSMRSIPIKEKANFGRLQIELPDIDERSLIELGAVDALQKQRIRRQICQKIAASIAEDFRLNVLPPTDGDSTLQTMTISFADKSRQSADGPIEKVFQLRPPTVVAATTISAATDYVQKKYSTAVQTVKAFGSQTEIKFLETGNVVFSKTWSYGVNRAFAPAYADRQVESVKRLLHRQAIENGFQKKFMDVVGKEKVWKELASKLAL